MRPDNDPTKLVDDWPLPDLSAIHRKKIKAILLRAHAAFHRDTDFNDPYKFIRPMQQAFDGIASVLFEANLLTVPFMENELRDFVIQSGASGGWLYPDQYERVTRTIFEAEIAEWHSKLLDRSVVEPSQIAIEQSSPTALRDSYFASFPGEKIMLLDLCWAAGQHYREWKRWIAGEVKDGSTADLAFRRTLSSGKRPHEYKAKPRPPKWQ